jgi:chlorobactene glucosyltransferase
MTTALELAVVILPLGPLLMTIANLATWRSPAPGVSPARVSALVPARDEEATIGACVRALLAEPFAEVLVYDDGSVDGTPRILDDLARSEPRLRVIRGGPLPAGWVGKTYACHRLASEARGERFVFVDADTVLERGSLARLGGADVVTALPSQRLGSFGERLVVPLLHLTYLSWLPLRWIETVSHPRVLAANGQVLSISRAAYGRAGGHAGIRSELVDDMALCRAAKKAGLVVSFVDGRSIAVCRMYRSFGDAFRGFAKNLHEGVGGSGPLAVVVALYVGCFLLPWVALPWVPVAAAVGIVANLLQRALLAARFRLGWSSVVTHAAGILVFVWIAWTSWRWARAGAIQWRGRAYAAREARTT